MQVLQGAVCPEVKMGLDDAVSAIASVTEVAVTNDLAIAKVYISVYSDQTGRDIAMKALSRLEGYVSDSCFTGTVTYPAQMSLQLSVPICLPAVRARHCQYRRSICM